MLFAYFISVSPDDGFTPVCTLSFPISSGPGTTRNFTFPINDDNLVEGTERIGVLATTVSEIASFAPGQDIAIINILDNDGKLLERVMMIVK